MTDQKNHHQHRSEREHEQFLEMPENHLDTVVSTGSIDQSKKASLKTTLVAVIMLPLFLVTGFTLAYNSSQSAPVPHDMALTLAGPDATTEQVADQISDRTDTAFDITRTTSADDARSQVESREAVGAVVIDGTSVTTIIASGEGRVAAGPIQQVGQQVANELGATVSVEDVAPVTDKDASGTGLFYFIILCTVAGYLSNTVISQTVPGARTRTMVATAVGAAVIAPIIGYAMLSIFIGDYDRTFGEIAAVIGVGMVYTLTIGLLSTIFTRVLGQASIFAVLVVCMFLNFPSTGGSVPESMLPGFWQVVHNTWVGSGAFETMRSIIFFDGAQAGRWFGQLALWAGAAAIVTTVVGVLQARKRKGLSQSSDASEPSREVTLAGSAL